VISLVANRPVFLASDRDLVERVDVEFEWFAGLSIVQKQKSVSALHLAASKVLGQPVGSVLEVSSKSTVTIGVELSAFNLKIPLDDGADATVESAFQGSKVFEHGGPYRDLIRKTSREAKKDERIKQSGRLLKFNSNGVDWPLDPPSAFYDWIYINALQGHPTLIQEVMCFGAFTDIEFNPKKQVNCQAHSAALRVALQKRGLLEEALSSPASYLSLMKRNRSRI
jgi:hypothetical protein